MRGEGDFGVAWRGRRARPDEAVDSPTPIAYPTDHMWRLYMELDPDTPAKPKESWRRLVPLRHRGCDPTIVGPPEGLADVRLGIEVFVYPHGTGVVASLYFEGAAHMSDVVDRLARARNENWTVDLGLDRAPTRASLEDIVRHIMQCVESTRLHNEDIEAALPSPFVVSAVVSLSGEMPPAYPDDSGTVHQQLHGLAILRTDWATRRPNKLEPGDGILDDSSLGGFTYAARRGRAIWYPTKAFVPESSEIPEALDPVKPRVRRDTLGCYSRNITMLTLQTESLLAYLRVAPDAHGDELKEVDRRLLNEVVNLTGRLNHRKPEEPVNRGSYYSASAPRHLADNNAETAMQEACIRIMRPPPTGWLVTASAKAGDQDRTGDPGSP